MTTRFINDDALLKNAYGDYMKLVHAGCINSEKSFFTRNVVMTNS